MKVQVVLFGTTTKLLLENVLAFSKYWLGKIAAINAEMLITFGEALGVMVITPVACNWATAARICAILNEIGLCQDPDLELFTSVKSNKLAFSLRSVSMIMFSFDCCYVCQAVFSPG